MVRRKQFKCERAPQQAAAAGLGEVVRILVGEPHGVHKQRQVPAHDLGAGVLGSLRIAQVQGFVCRIPLPPVEEELRVPLEETQKRLLGRVL